MPPSSIDTTTGDSGIIAIMRDKTANAAAARRGVGKPGSRRAPATKRPRRAVAILAYDGLSPFDLGVACEVFGGIPPVPGVPWYSLSLCGAVPGPVTAVGGFVIQVPHGLDRLRYVDMVIVPPTEQLERVPTQVFEALRRAHARGVRVASFCTGAFVLAEAGLLDGRRATTHWSECDDLARRYPRVSVDPAVLYVDEGDVLTSAGSAASIDLCLHIVRQDYGAEVASQLARQLVVSPQRDGGQAQFIDTPMPVLASSNLFAQTVAWLQQHLGEQVTVDELAARAAMSPRTFARRFLASTGTTPYQWLLRERVLFAQRLLETTDLPIELVAAKSGFGTAGAMRTYFRRAISTSPQTYRRAFKDRRAS
jgi:transcriptional regulator GlxA family with amidase domain